MSIFLHSNLCQTSDSLSLYRDIHEKNPAKPCIIDIFNTQILKFPKSFWALVSK